MAQELLYQWPTIVDGVIMVSPGGYQTPRLLDHYKAFRFGQGWQELAGEGVEQDSVAEEYTEGTDGASGINGQFESVKNLERIPTDVPVLLIRGDKDKWSTEELAREISERKFPNSLFINEPEAGHQDILKIRPMDKNGQRKNSGETFFTQTSVDFIFNIIRKTNSQVVKEKISFAHKNLRDLYKWSKFKPFNEWLENNNYRYFLDFSKNPQEDKIKEVIAKWESFAKSKIIDISKDKLVNYQYLGRQESMIANNENQQNIQKILNKPESEITLHELIVLVKFIEKSN